MDVRTPTPLMRVQDDRLRGVDLLLKRDDLLHPDLPGNKWRKLKYLLEHAAATRATTLLTFGGAFSNHIRAVAAAGRLLGYRTVGVIRGEERPVNDGLVRAQADGMIVHYLDRASYRRKTEPDVLATLRGQFGDFYLIPEGGTTPFAVRGCAEIVEEIDEPFDVVTCAVGTGGTLAGLAAGLSPGQRALGFSVLRGATSLDADVAELVTTATGRRNENWRIDHDHHCGGFARRSPALDVFVEDFARRHGVRVDHLYVGKMLFGLYDLVERGELSAGSTVIAVVTGSPSL